MKKKSWKRNPFLLKIFARRLRKPPRQAPGKHPEGTQEAPGGGRRKEETLEAKADTRFGKLLGTIPDPFSTIPPSRPAPPAHPASEPRYGRGN